MFCNLGSQWKVLCWLSNEANIAAHSLQGWWHSLESFWVKRESGSMNKYFEFIKHVGHHYPLNANTCKSSGCTPSLCKIDLYSALSFYQVMWQWLSCTTVMQSGSNLVCSIHKQLPTNHPQQLVVGIQWVYIGITRVSVATGHRLGSHVGLTVPAYTLIVHFQYLW